MPQSVVLRTLTLCVWATACGDTNTSVLVDLQMAPGESAPASLFVSVYDPTHALVLDRLLANPRIPGRLVIELPNIAVPVRVVANGPVTGASRIESGAVAPVTPFGQTALTLTLSSSTPDGDGDGVPDSVDNCMMRANPDQTVIAGGNPCVIDAHIGAPARCGGAGTALCDDFEAASIDSTLWTPLMGGTGALSLDASRAARGSQSLHVRLDAQTSSGELGQELTATRTLPAVATFLRAFVFLSAAPNASFLLMRVSRTQPYRTTAIQMVNDGGLSLFYFQGTGSPLNQTRATGSQIPFGHWACLELELADQIGAGNDGVIRAWLDGQDLGIASGIPAQPDPGDDQLAIGAAHAATPTIPAFDVWFDSVAVDANPIGCAR